MRASDSLSIMTVCAALMLAPAAQVRAQAPVGGYTPFAPAGNPQPAAPASTLPATPPPPAPSAGPAGPSSGGPVTNLNVTHVTFADGAFAMSGPQRGQALRGGPDTVFLR